MTKRVQVNGGRIDLHVNVVEVLSKQESLYTEEQLKAFEVLQKKAEQGYKDVEGFIKTRIIQQEQTTVTILIGKTAIIDSDIKHQLKEAIGRYDFKFVRINIGYEADIIKALKENDEAQTILAVARGGGENMEVFNKVPLAESYFITAIGHKEDISLLQKVADKGFINPTAQGQTVEELQGSKAKLWRT